mmetsp:Transcript_78533/g.182219  ORF Transcript_78533/g.182219 Transcript_78533/m.182219 type:complete len:210 (+) Transcript_78533:355-984(+)
MESDTDAVPGFPVVVAPVSSDPRNATCLPGPMTWSVGGTVVMVMVVEVKVPLVLEVVVLLLVELVVVEAVLVVVVVVVVVVGFGMSATTVTTAAEDRHAQKTTPTMHEIRGESATLRKCLRSNWSVSSGWDLWLCSATSGRPPIVRISAKVTCSQSSSRVPVSEMGSWSSSWSFKPSPGRPLLLQALQLPILEAVGCGYPGVCWPRCRC